MCNHVAFDTHKAFRYLIKNASNADNMRDLHEQYSLWKEGEPGRHLQKPNEDALQRYFSPGKENATLPCLVRGAGGHRLAQFTWGFIPNWRSDKPHGDPLKAVDRQKKALDIGRKTWNAASETMFDDEKPTWRDSAHDRRCVIVLDGFFTFHEQDDETYPFFIAPKDYDCLPVAGLWDVATIDGKEYLTCAILTKEADEPMHQINNGGTKPHTMPIVLNPEHFDAWLDPIDKEDYEKVEALSALMKLPSTRELEYITVAKNADGRVDNSDEVFNHFEYKELKINVTELSAERDL
jgi:putative SOS response-associated peptidase YedK